ncbi:MAG: dihydroorotate dehydrogenase electron transfer subunit [Gammaproteobacteria bacterium]|nr:dihydroorotate dehydrogenase electron transfer subunit [Gammaproteobacteria bacterium]MDH4255841.1 dihydroorotate dehydrogenase electron transfer subunit [Gammaproteobacteria bacterium]MDH5309305.1 dihydroorotate dehydrogenase electron transfer subunit [Gammaproteobacteria bacterium]
MSDPARPHRGTIFVEDAEVLSIDRHPGGQFILRLRSPKCATRATAGSFVHVQCDHTIPMRRPLSIMRANADEGWIEVLFKVVGEGLFSLGHKEPGDRVSSLGPIGKGFRPDAKRPRTLLIGGGVGIPPMIFLAETLLNDAGNWQPLAIMGSELPFPFELRRSAIAAGWIDADVDRNLGLLEDWGVAGRLASLTGFPGTYRGYVTGLAERYLASLDDSALAEVEVFSCGPTPMLKAVAALAARFGLPCQVSLEEYMACAVGGCAGCAVLVQTDEGPAMKRVCVDGPVFDAARVFAAA